MSKGLKAFTTMLYRTGRSTSRSNSCTVLPSPFERVFERHSNACIFTLHVRTHVKRNTNASLLFSFCSNALSNATRTRSFYFLSVRTRYQTQHERQLSVSRSNALSNATRTQVFCFGPVRMRLRTQHERPRSVMLFLKLFLSLILCIAS